MPLPAADERNRFAQHLFAPLPERYDRLAEVLSFWARTAGGGGPWSTRRRARAPAAAGQVILDVASGTAGVALQLAGADRRHASSAWT